jgi:hypothetical protein
MIEEVDILGEIKSFVQSFLPEKNPFPEFFSEKQSEPEEREIISNDSSTAGTISTQPRVKIPSGWAGKPCEGAAFYKLLGCGHKSCRACWLGYVDGVPWNEQPACPRCKEKVDRVTYVVGRCEL